ncbi:collectin-12-like [Haliotis asinina]|uniref:collectin-12-like n=1 Tax=Haliotis asinina TaxID=109174 RepID=UPI00353260C0
MWCGSGLVIMIAMKPLLGYVLHPVGVEMCREFCCQRRAIYESNTSTCVVHSRLHRSRTQGVKCVADSSKSKCTIGYQHPRKSNGWPPELRDDYSKCRVGSETIYVKRIYAEMSWDGAKKTCEGDGAQLVIVDDKETMKQVAKLFRLFESAIVWIGMRDLCNNNTFLWLDGETPTFTKWARNEPTHYDEGRPEKCVKMRYTFAGGK